MRYWKVVIYRTGGEWETTEYYIDEPTFRQYQKAIIENKDFIVLENKIIKRTLIKEILPANEEIDEYLKQGVHLKTLGLKELPELQGKNVHLDGLKSAGEIIKETKSQ